MTIMTSPLLSLIRLPTSAPAGERDLVAQPPSGASEH
jgi:hypothetical protein